MRNESETFPANGLFHQDGAPPHTSHDACDLSRDIFGDNWIGNYGPENWPARSPDITPPVFFVCGCVKDRVFTILVNYVIQLKRRITGAIRSITQGIFNKVWKDLGN